MPVLGVAHCGLAVVFVLVEFQERPAFELSQQLVLRVDAEAFGRPVISGAEKMPGEQATPPHAPDYPFPHVGKSPRLAERQCEAGIDEVRCWQRGTVLESSAHRAELVGCVGGRLLVQDIQGMRIPVEGNDDPAGTEQRQAVAAGAATQIQCQAGIAWPQVERFAQVRLRGGASGRFEEVAHQNGAGLSKRMRSPVCGWVSASMLACRHRRSWACSACSWAESRSPSSGWPVESMCTRNWCERPVIGVSSTRLKSPQRSSTRQKVSACLPRSWSTTWRGFVGGS